MSSSLGGDHDLDVCRLRRLAQLDRCLPAVKARHHDVQGDDVRRDRPHLLKVLARRRRHVESPRVRFTAISCPITSSSSTTRTRPKPSRGRGYLVWQRTVYGNPSPSRPIPLDWYPRSHRAPIAQGDRAPAWSRVRRFESYWGAPFYVRNPGARDCSPEGPSSHVCDARNRGRPGRHRVLAPVAACPAAIDRKHVAGDVGGLRVGEQQRHR